MDEVDGSFLGALVVVVVVSEAGCLGAVGLGEALGGSGVVILSSTGGATELTGNKILGLL